MEFKKCNRCGCFFLSENNVCCSCADKDKIEIIKLNNYIEETIDEIPSVDDLSANTGVTVKNIKRFAENNSLANFNFKL